MSACSAPPRRRPRSRDIADARDARRARPGRRRASSPPGVERGGLRLVAARRRAVGLRRRGTLGSLCYAGANLVPVAATPEAVARRSPTGPAGRAGAARRSSGPAEQVAAAVGSCSSRAGARPARSAADQPLMVDLDEPAVDRGRPAGAPGRRGRARHPAARPASRCSPRRSASRRAGRRRRALPRPGRRARSAPGRAFARIEDGEVVFKAEIGAVTPQACQIQGVWVRPRGGGADSPRRGWRPSSTSRGGRSRPWCPVRQRLQRRRPGRVPPGRASSRAYCLRAVLTATWFRPDPTSRHSSRLVPRVTALTKSLPRVDPTPGRRR